MIVLGLSASLLVATTLAAMLMLLGIDMSRQGASQRLF